MYLPDTIQYGQMNGIEQGQCYIRRVVVETYGHQAEIKYLMLFMVESGPGVIHSSK